MSRIMVPRRELILPASVRRKQGGFLLNPYRFGRLWTPADATTALWLDAADSATITHSSGAVSQWDDKSGNSYSFTQGTGSLKPTTNASTLNSLNVLDFAGDYLTSTAAASTWNFLHNGTKWSLYAVVKFGTGSDPNAAYGLFGTNAATTAANGGCVFFDDRSSLTRNNGIGCIVSNNASPSVMNNYSGNSFLSPNAALLYALRADPANATASARSTHVLSDDATAANNSLTGSPSASNASYTLQIGTTGNAVLPMTGQIAELIIVSGDVTSDNDDRFWGYLAHRWGLAGNLPGGHPYKSSPPTI